MDQQKKLIILAVLGVCAVASMMYGLTASPKKKHRGPATPQVARKAAGSALKAPAAAPVPRRAARTKFTSLRRSPFSPKAAAGGSSIMSLNGILSDGKAFKAVIGDTIVKKGDRIGQYTVVDIKKDCCTLNDGTTNYELKLER